MFCPNCARENSIEQSFCRACGLNLEKTSESLREQLPEAGNANLARREQFLERFGNFAFGGFMIVLTVAVGAIIYAIFEKFVLSGANVFFGIFLILFIIFAVLTLLFVIYTEKLKEEKQNSNLRRKNEIAEPRRTAELLEEKPFEPVPSVVENSTELILTESETRKFD